MAWLKSLYLTFIHSSIYFKKYICFNLIRKIPRKQFIHVITHINNWQSLFGVPHRKDMQDLKFLPLLLFTALSGPLVDSWMDGCTDGWTNRQKRLKKKISLMARHFPPPPLDGPAIKGRFFFVASLIHMEKIARNSNHKTQPTD